MKRNGLKMSDCERTREKYRRNKKMSSSGDVYSTSTESILGLGILLAHLNTLEPKSEPSSYAPPVFFNPKS